MSGKEKGCPAVGQREVEVCIPVEIIPFVKVGSVKTKCCGEPVIKNGDCHCQGKKNGTCSFTISQTLNVEVPIFFGANTQVGDMFVDCACDFKEDHKHKIECNY